MGILGAVVFFLASLFFHHHCFLSQKLVNRPRLKFDLSLNLFVLSSLCFEPRAPPHVCDHSGTLFFIYF